MSPSRRITRPSNLSFSFLLVAVGLSIAAISLIASSNQSGDPDSVWGVALFGLAIPTWVAFTVQFRSDLDWDAEIKRLAALHRDVNEVQTELDKVRTALHDTVASLSTLASTLSGVMDGIGEARRAIGGLAEAADQARQQAILTELTAPGPHRGFHGQASRLSGFHLVPRTDLTGAVLNGCRWDHFEADDVVLVNAKMRDLFFANTTANRAQLQGADLTNSHLAGSFARAQLSGTTINRTTFEGHWRRAHVEHSYFESASFSNCDLRESCFQRLDDVTMTCYWLASLCKATFHNIRLPVVDFRWADLTDARFEEIRQAIGDELTTFEGALLVRTDFSGVELASLHAWKMRDAIVDDAKWPAGFDPMRSGALVVGKTDPEVIRAQVGRRIEVRGRRDRCPDHSDWGAAGS